MPAPARSLSSILLLLLSAAAQAGGLWIRDFGDESQGRVAAGEAAGTESAGTVARNPAGMALLDESQWAGAAFALYGDIEFDIGSSDPLLGTNDGGTIGSTAPAGGIGYVRKLNDRWSVGIGAAGLTGAQIEYNDGWVGRYQAQRVELLGIAVAPAISWQATEKLSLGIGLPIFYTDLELDVAIPNVQDPILGPDGQAKLDGDDTNVGVQLGAIYQFNDRTRLGVMYLSEYEQQFGGDVDLDLEVGSATVAVQTDLTFAQLVRVGLAHELNQELTLYLGAGWEDWSAMKEVLISGETQGVSIPTNWDDTWHASAGFRWRKGDGFEFQMGLAYDSNPVDNEDRRADLPLDRQIRIGTSASWQHNKRWRIGTFLTLIDLGDAEIGSAELFDGDYDPNRIFIVGANLQFYPQRR